MDDKLFEQGLERRNATLGKMEEFQIHTRGALNNGVSVEEIRAARKVLEEAGTL